MNYEIVECSDIVAHEMALRKRKSELLDEVMKINCELDALWAESVAYR